MDPDYLALRDHDQFAEVRASLGEMWRRYEPYADPHFLEEFGRQFQQRYWEMCLGCCFLDLRFSLSPGCAAGPDLDVCSPKGIRAYVEAVAVTAGTGADAVPDYDFSSDDMTDVPTDQIVLRIRSGIGDKARQREEHLAKGLIDPSVAYVIAVNVGGIPRGSIRQGPPTVAQACLGVDNLMLMLESGKPVEKLLGRRDQVSKASGATVGTNLFGDPSFSWLSAVLLSDERVFRVKFPAIYHQLLHNHDAEHRLPLGWFSRGSEHWYSDGKLHSRRR